MTAQLSTIEAGTPLPAIRKALTQENITGFEQCMSAMMDLGETRANIHTDPEMARRAGLGAPVASGMMSTAFLNQMLLEAFGEAWAHTGHLAVSFIASLRAGDEAATGGVITSATPEDGGQRVEAEVWCENQRGEKVTVGRADVVLARR